MSKKISFFAQKWARYSLTALIIFVLAGIYFFSRGGAKQGAIVFVSRGNVTEEVALTGTIKPIHELNLGFEKGGKIAGSYVKVGDRVYPGMDLVRLDSSEMQASLLSARATLKEARANLAALLRGARSEEIAVEEAKVRSADQALSDYERLLLDTTRDGYTKADDAVRNKGDQLFSNPRVSPQFNYNISDSELKKRLESGRANLENQFNQFGAKVVALSVTDDLEGAALDGENLLLSTAVFLNDLSAAINTLSSTPLLTQTTIDGWKSNIATARTNVNTAASSLSSAEKNARDAKSALFLAEEQLKLKRANATPEEIAAAEAKVDEASAAVLSAQAILSKMTIRSPIEGIVTKQDQRSGEIVSVGEPVISLISAGEFEIEASVPEVDVGALQVSMPMTFNLDAFPGEVFKGSIIKINPAETVIDGVPTYTVTFRLDKTALGVKPGMTANITVVTDQRVSVLVVPLRSVETRDDGSYVNVLSKDGSKTLRKIVTGLRGTDGSVEVVSGLKSNEQIFLDRVSK